MRKRIRELLDGNREKRMPEAQEPKPIRKRRPRGTGPYAPTAEDHKVFIELIGMAAPTKPRTHRITGGNNDK